MQHTHLPHPLLCPPTLPLWIQPRCTLCISQLCCGNEQLQTLGGLCCCYCSVTKLYPTLCDPWAAACQAPLSSTISQSLLKLMSIVSVMLSFSDAPFSFCLQSFPASGSFPMSQFFASSGQSIGASASAAILLMNIQGLFPLGLTDLISLYSKGLSRVFCSTTI